MSHPLTDVAAEVLGLDGLRGDEEAVALVPVVHGAVWPGLGALAALDLATLPSEPDLDPGRAPRPPVA